MIKEIIIPGEYNYIGVFLTLNCNYHCSYCINYFENNKLRNEVISGKNWVKGLNRIVPRDGLPITLQGGEPSIHKDFIYIINNIKPELKIDILTNMQFDVDKFIRHVDPERIKRDAPYASIRVSYHPETMDLNETFSKVLSLQEKGFSVGIWGVLHPGQKSAIFTAQEKAKEMGIDFRVKEFLGYYKDSLYGTYKYEDACKKEFRKSCFCRTTELIIGPSGSVYRCHSDLYESRKPIGSILDSDFEIKYEFLPCGQFGFCNPCDIKIKTNRFQQFGHTSVDLILK